MHKSINDCDMIGCPKCREAYEEFNKNGRTLNELNEQVFGPSKHMSAEDRQFFDSTIRTYALEKEIKALKAERDEQALTIKKLWEQIDKLRADLAFAKRDGWLPNEADLWRDDLYLANAENSKLRELLKISKEYLNKFLISDENKRRLNEVDIETLKMLVLHSAYVAEEGLAKLGEDV